MCQGLLLLSVFLVIDWQVEAFLAFFLLHDIPFTFLFEGYFCSVAGLKLISVGTFKMPFHCVLTYVIYIAKLDIYLFFSFNSLEGDVFAFSFRF